MCPRRASIISTGIHTSRISEDVVCVCVGQNSGHSRDTKETVPIAYIKGNDKMESQLKGGGYISLCSSRASSEEKLKLR